MKTLAFVTFVALASATGCAAKPTEAECTQAVDNIRKLTGQAHAEGGADPKMAIRSCRARSKKATVDCQIAARSLDDLAACEGDEGKAAREQMDKAETEAAEKQK